MRNLYTDDPFYQERWKLILSDTIYPSSIRSILSREVEANSQQGQNHTKKGAHFIKRGGS